MLLGKRRAPIPQNSVTLTREKERQMPVQEPKQWKEAEAVIEARRPVTRSTANRRMRLNEPTPASRRSNAVTKEPRGPVTVR